MSKIGKFLAGLTLGAGAAYLFAPKSGAENRKDVKKAFDDMLLKVKEIDVDDVKKEFEKKVNEIKSELESLDKEKVAKIAKKQAKELQNKVDDLVDYAVKKGTPVLKKTADAMREQVVIVAQEVIDKLDTKGE